MFPMLIMDIKSLVDTKFLEKVLILFIQTAITTSSCLMVVSQLLVDIK